MGILIPLVIIFFCCLFIWRACDGFELASEYIGRNLSEGVRGGTINAISSSLPELFTTLIALFVLADQDGFAVGLGTTAGSALFNGMVIPAACILAVVGGVVLGRRVQTVRVSTKVLLRDGLSLIACEIVLIVAINGTQLHWWHGLLLMGLYAAYLALMTLSMKAAGDAADGDAADKDEEGEADENEQEAEDGEESRTWLGAVFYWLSLGPCLDLEGWLVGDEQRKQIKAETWNGWPLLMLSATVIGATCWLLVRACEWLGTGPGNETDPHYELLGVQFAGLGMPAMFVAVIFASMATSVPDTIISIRDARDGDYDDAVANALGSNIFDVCFALGFPLFAYTALRGPIELSLESQQRSSELRLLLLFMTIAGFLIYLAGRRGRDEAGARYVEMGRNKAWALLAIYGLFVVYVVGKGFNAFWAQAVSDWLRLILDTVSLG